mgnify:CR=1 FL=1|tara:strand:+ start:25504 stop:26415 length:912 start_codon:yes stop_codon:yes gene_type:complete
MKILLTGSTGQLGQDILKRFSKKYYFFKPSRKELDLTRLDYCELYLEKIKPDIIINCAAYTEVDKAEIDINNAYIVNAYAPELFANHVSKFGGKLLHISTDFVFDGNKNKPYSPSDKRNPINVYGKSKALGEELIELKLGGSGQAIILRTSWLMSNVGKNFNTTMINLLTNKEIISVVNDQLGSPTFTNSLSLVCSQIIKLNFFETLEAISSKTSVPILHWAEDGPASWYEVALEISKLMKNMKISNKIAKVIPISSMDYPTLAIRPSYSVLGCESTKKFLNLKSVFWRDSLKKILIYKKNQI